MRRFEELQEIWNTQNDQTMYTINEEALRYKVTSAKNSATHVLKRSEQVVMYASFGTSLFILFTNIIIKSTVISLYALALWAFAGGVYGLINSIRKKIGARQFDRSIKGELDHAIFITNYQVRLSYVMRLNIIPTGILITLTFLERGQLSGFTSGLIILIIVSLAIFVLSFFGSRWEHNIYSTRKKNLEELKKKLTATEV